jgi:L-iditol 2-dehydrogenase
MLVRVEACGICGTDVHEYKRDPFGLIPVVLGHEGTGHIVAVGSEGIKDFQGLPLEVGDPIVTSVLVPEDCPFTHRWPHLANLSDGLPDSADYHLNGYFATHLVVRANSTVFKVDGMTWKQRILIEPMAVTVHALERAKTTGLMNFGSTVVVQGCGPIGLMMIATLHAYGISKIIAIDSVPHRLEVARSMGAATALPVAELGPEGVLSAVRDLTSGFECCGGYLETRSTGWWIV